VRVLLGYGNGSFANQMMYSAGSNPFSIAVGDFNNDTRIDIVVTNLGSNDMSVFLQYNRGALTNEGTYAYGGASHLQYVTVGNMNNDTHLDIVVANYGTNNIGFLYGYGNGTFESQITLDTGSNSHPSCIAIADFDGDTQLDIAVTNYGTKSVDILLGNGEGTYVSQINYGTGFVSAPFVIVNGNLNNDRRSEIVAAYDDYDNVDILVAHDTGSFTDQMMYLTGPSPIFVAVADLNNDGQLDFVVVNSNNNSVSVFLGYGSGSFSNEIRYLTGSDPQFLAVADFNNDKRLDIVVSNEGSDDVSILLGYGNGSFANQTKYSTGTSPRSVAAGDFNNDTQLDIVVANNGNDSVSIGLGYDNGSFANQTKFSTGASPLSVAVGDFNNDTQLDIVVANNGNDSVSVLLGYGNGSFASQTTYSTGSAPWFVTVGDFNNDSRLDIIVANSGSNDVSLLLGSGNGSFADQLIYSIGPYPRFIAVADFNNDTRLDIIVATSGDNNVRVLLGYSNGSFSNPMIHSAGSRPFSVAVGDFNDDSRLDIVTANLGSNSASIQFGCANEVFQKQTTLTTGNNSQPRSIVIADFNNDDQMDIAVANSGSHNIGIFLGYGNISFSNQMTSSTGPYSSPYSIAAGDFNNDTQLDIVVANYDSDSISVFLGYGNGSFANQTTYSTGSNSLPYSVAVGDFNSDTILDIVVANYGTSHLDVLLGYGNGTFGNLTSWSLTYGDNPFSVVIGDFNSDNKLDFAVANEGSDSLNIFLQTC
jgi:hypothetical protein